MKTRAVISTMEAYSAGKKKVGAIKLSSNENPLGTSPKVKEAIVGALENIYRYPDGLAGELKAKIAFKNGVGLKNVTVGNGSDELFALVCGAYVNPGDEVITGLNTFSEYTFSAKLFDGKLLYVDLNDGIFDLDRISDCIGDRTRVIFLCNPNNPTGGYFSEDDLCLFMDSLSKDIAVVLDEAYGEFADAEDYPDSVKLISRYPNLLVSRTFSKVYGLAGLRIGYILADSGVIDSLNRCKQAFNVNSLAQVGAIAALDDDHFFEQSVRLVREGKIFLYKELERLGFTYYKTQSNFICINLKSDAEEAYSKIAEGGITIRSLRSFGLNQSIRYTIGTPENNKLFIRLLEQLSTENF